MKFLAAVLAAVLVTTMSPVAFTPNVAAPAVEVVTALVKLVIRTPDVPADAEVTSNELPGAVVPTPTFPSLIIVKPLPPDGVGCTLKNKPFAVAGVAIFLILKKPLVELSAALLPAISNAEPFVIASACICSPIPSVVAVFILSAAPVFEALEASISAAALVNAAALETFNAFPDVNDGAVMLIPFPEVALVVTFKTLPPVAVLLK